MSKIVTFYSYKGGVGRSMALANIAFELSRLNKNVLMVDWDLEAPGLEKYFSHYKIDTSAQGLLQMLNDFKNGLNPNYKNYLSMIHLTSEKSISLLPSGRDSNPMEYSYLLQNLDWNNFFALNGGIYLENLRLEWLNDFDIILVDSRTGLSDASGICTILMPDILVPMFTANYQSLFGTRDIISYIQDARQKLQMDRMGLTVLPIPSRFGTRVEFKESHEWLDRFADLLKSSFADWLPQWISPRHILEQIKIPQIDYFSFGEKLAVVEQGVSDPEGMGFIYNKIASLLGSESFDTKSFVGTEYYDMQKAEFDRKSKSSADSQESEYLYDLFISCQRVGYQWVRELLVPALSEYLFDEIGHQPRIFFDMIELGSGDQFTSQINSALLQSKTLLMIFSSSNSDRDFLDIELGHFLLEELQGGEELIFPIIYRASDNPFENMPESLAKKHVYDFSNFRLEEVAKSTKLTSQFGSAVEKLAKALSKTLANNKINGIGPASQAHATAKISTKLELNELLRLAVDYEEIRKTKRSGDSRTRSMDALLTQMKDVSTGREDFLPGLTKSTRPGERLAAIAILQKYPKLSYISWLADRVGDSEKPFVGYHASLALFLATKSFGASHKLEVKKSLERAITNWSNSEFQDANQDATLKAAMTELSLIHQSKIKKSIENLKQSSSKSENIKVLDDIVTSQIDFYNDDPEILFEILLAYNRFGEYQKMIDLFEKLNPDVKNLTKVQDQLGLALDRSGQSITAIKILETSINENRAGAETYSILGRIYKNLSAEALSKGDDSLSNAYLDKALDSYSKGFGADWRDAYPGIHALTIMELKGERDEIKKLAPVVEFAAKKQLEEYPYDYWVYAILLEIATMTNSRSSALENLHMVIRYGSEKWMLETTRINLTFILEKRRSRNEDYSLLEEVIQILEQQMK